jgi:Acyl-coenzyme A:6-aminopenicillanic acid acyl-transferase
LVEEDRMKKRILIGLLLLVLCGIGVWTAGETEECTSLVATGTATVDGGSLLWKNRDNPSELSNKVVFVEDTPYSYLALVDGEPANGRLAWAALNAAGFAVANTATTNLPASEPSGNPSILMGDAARTCATVDEFEQFLKRNFGKNRGTRSNFLAVDAKGGAAIFETHATGVKRLNAADAPQRYLGNTNFSRTGTPDQGGGYLRFEREAALLSAAPAGKLSVDYVLQVMSRDLGHTLLHHPERAQWRTFPADTPVWLHTNHTIDRPSTASAVLIRNVKPGEDPRRATMWVMLGEPLTSIAVPLWVAAGAPPSELWEGKDAALSKESARLKDVLRPLRSAERREYLDVTRLDNASGTGWLPTTLAAERENLRQTDELLAKNPTASDLAAFEKTLAARALALLQKTAVPPTGTRQ